MAKLRDEDLTPEELAEREEAAEDLAASLKQAKRQPRFFAIIANGKEVVSLLIRKKPLRDAVVKRARRDEGGKQTYQGICEGSSGSILVFKFSGGLPKFKPGRLRQFIAETTGIMVKPEFSQLNVAASSIKAKP
jgi:hypothetical protein